MKILVIGGTIFLGRHFVEQAIAKGHSVTILHTGRSNTGLFGSNVQELIMNRNDDMTDVSSQNYDAVLDTCGYTTKSVRHSVESFIGKTKQYVFISSVSVYTDFNKIGINENEPIDYTNVLSDVLLNANNNESSLPTGKVNIDEVVLNNQTYGLLKYYCEQEVLKRFKEQALIIRPGLIVGSYDPTDRYSYWIWRINQAKKTNRNDILIPAEDFNIQFISGNDLAKWILHCIESNSNGIYNATSNQEIMFKKLLEDCESETNHTPNYVLMSDEFIKENEVIPWLEIPLWVGDEEATKGFSKIDSSKALTNGLKFSPLNQIVAETLDYMNTLSENYELKAGLAPEKESHLLNLLGY